MAQKPETTFITSVHKHFPSKEVPHREKMNNPYSSGTADVWYSYSKSDLWVEYKFVPKFPVKSNTVLADLTALQTKWLRKRYHEGRKVYVILGCPTGGILLKDLEWEVPLLITKVIERLQSRESLANWILGEVKGESNDG